MSADTHCKAIAVLHIAMLGLAETHRVQQHASFNASSYSWSSSAAGAAAKEDAFDRVFSVLSADPSVKNLGTLHTAQIEAMMADPGFKHQASNLREHVERMNIDLSFQNRTKVAAGYLEAIVATPAFQEQVKLVGQHGPDDFLRRALKAPWFRRADLDNMTLAKSVPYGAPQMEKLLNQRPSFYWLPSRRVSHLLMLLLLWSAGILVLRHRHFPATAVFVSRLLLFVYAAAFASLASQADGLFGPQGISPEAFDGDNRTVWHRLTLASLRLQKPARLAAIAGTVAFLAAFLPSCQASGVAAAAVQLWVRILYQNFVRGGSEFLRFQWDVLLLESGALGSASNIRGASGKGG